MTTTMAVTTSAYSSSSSFSSSAFFSSSPTYSTERDFPQPSPQHSPPPFPWDSSYSDSGAGVEASHSPPSSPSPSSASASAPRIVCVRNFLASHGSDVKNHPGLVGICAVCRDRVAVSDRWNKVVKLLDISGRVMDVLMISAPGGTEPWDLALRRPGVLAVTYPKEQKIRMVDVADGASRMYYRSHFATRHGYASLASLDPNRLLASVCPPFGSPRVHVLDYMGVILRSLDCSHLAYPRCLDVCGGDEICVSDWTHHNVKVFSLRSTEDVFTSNSTATSTTTTTDTTNTEPNINSGPSQSTSTSTLTTSSSSPSPSPLQARVTYTGVPGGPCDVQLKAPMGVGWNGRGHVFVADGKGSRLHAVCLTTGECSAIFSLPQAPGAGDLKLVTFVDASPELCPRSERALVVTTTTGSVQVYDLGASF